MEVKSSVSEGSSSTVLHSAGPADGPHSSAPLQSSPNSPGSFMHLKLMSDITLAVLLLSLLYYITLVWSIFSWYIMPEKPLNFSKGSIKSNLYSYKSLMDNNNNSIIKLLHNFFLNDCFDFKLLDVVIVSSLYCVLIFSNVQSFITKYISWMQWSIKVQYLPLNHVGV